jgi:hypothetical protein
LRYLAEGRMETIPDWLDQAAAHLLPLKFEAFMMGL